MSEQKVRWGLLSTANINRRLIPAIRASVHGELTAVASRSQQSALNYAQKWEIPHAFANYQAMLDSDKIDAVYIGLPNHLHTEWAVRALESGKHVLCEKPFALTLRDVDTMINTAEKTGMVLAEAFMYRHHPQTKILGEWVQSGRLGDIKLVRGVFNFAFGNRENIRLVPEYGGGCLWDVGVYPVSMAQYLMGGAPDWVLGDQWVGQTGVDEVFSAQMHYSGGRMAQISASFCTPYYTYVDILGTKGRITLTRPFTGLNNPDRLMLFTPPEGEPHEISVPDKELYIGEVEDMHYAILDKTAPYLTLGETRAHVQTVLALYESARMNQIVHL